MRGEKAHQRCFLIDLIGVVTRRSTDILAVEDRLVAKTMTFIQSGACEGITVRDVATALAVSRSGLETRFRLGHGLHVHAGYEMHNCSEHGA